MKRFVIIITMLAYFSACSRTAVIPLESVEPVACRPIHGVVLQGNQRVIFNQADGRYDKKQNSITGTINEFDSVSYHLRDIRKVLILPKSVNDSIVAVRTKAFKSSYGKWSTLGSYHVSGAVRQDGHPLRFAGESGRLNCGDYSLSGVLTTGDRFKLSIDSVSTIRVTNSRLMSRGMEILVISCAVALAVALTVALVLAGLHNWEPGPIGSGRR
jgi:hypothetical protein